MVEFGSFVLLIVYLTYTWALAILAIVSFYSIKKLSFAKKVTSEKIFHSLLTWITVNISLLTVFGTAGSIITILIFLKKLSETAFILLNYMLLSGYLVNGMIAVYILSEIAEKFGKTFGFKEIVAK